jgi:hypothetical protein
MDRVSAPIPWLAPGAAAATRSVHGADQLPDGTFVVEDHQAYVVFGERLLRWTPPGYVAGGSLLRRGQATVLTPPSLVEILRTGWRPSVPLIHPSAGDPLPG